jgi:hypothetical protein
VFIPTAASGKLLCRDDFFEAMQSAKTERYLKYLLHSAHVEAFPASKRLCLTCSFLVSGTIIKFSLWMR